jgi:hypothetical protein
MMAARKARTPLAKQVDERRLRIREAYAARHPARARDERELRKANAAVQAKYGKKLYGTPETHAKAATVQQGALARLCLSGSIDADQLAYATEIRRVAERIGADVAIGIASLETRVDQSRHFGDTFFEKLGAVRAEVAYSAWRSWLPAPGPVLAMIVDDVACSLAAKQFRRDTRTMRKLLIEALDAWPNFRADARREVNEATLLAAQAALL